MQKKTVLIISPYPKNTAASQRFRYEQYLDLLNERFKIKQVSFYNYNLFNKLYKKKNISFYVGFFIAFFRTPLNLFILLPQSSIVFIHREVLPLGPPILEFVISQIFKKKVIYDFDDAIWLRDSFQKENFFSKLKYRSKSKYLIKWSQKVSVGNDFLANFSKQFNPNVIVNPTTIDQSYHSPKNRNRNRNIPVIGWTGTHSTLPYLHLIESVLCKIEKENLAHFVVIANQKPELKLKQFEFINWNQKDEIEQLRTIDIGIMPLHDDDWSKGKCGFKLLQYMSLGIPAVASPVGVNSKIVKHEYNGFLAQSQEEWYLFLKELIKNEDLRKKFGKNGIETISKYYSKNSNKSNFLSIFSF
ncbi:MAG: glycosyltransferase [Cyclobacteriaceae bacterium]|nr:glycosyltransferase [Cyclobacteriaceae bacterium]